MGNVTTAPPATIRVDAAAPSASFALKRMLRRLVMRGHATLPVRVDEAASVAARLKLNVPRTDAGRKHGISLRETATSSEPGKAPSCSS